MLSLCRVRSKLPHKGCIYVFPVHRAICFMKYASVVLVTYSAYDLARVVDNRDSLLERHVVVKVLLPTSWSFSPCQDTARRSLI